MGIETALSPSAEIRDPRRVVPRGLALGIAGITLLYLSLQLVAQSALGAGLATATEAPLASAATVVLGSWGRVLILGAGVVCMAGVLPGDLLATPRVLYAMGEDGLLPAALGQVHPRFHTPAAAIATYAFVCAVLALSGTFRSLAILAAAGTLVMYLMTVLSVLALRRSGATTGEAPFIVPGGPIVPIVAAIAIVLVLSTLAWKELAAIGVMLAVAAVPFALEGAGRGKSGTSGNERLERHEWQARQGQSGDSAQERACRLTRPPLLPPCRPAAPAALRCALPPCRLSSRP